VAISNDVQKLEPGNTIRLVEVDGTKFGADILCFHNETIPHSPAEITAAGPSWHPKASGGREKSMALIPMKLRDWKHPAMALVQRQNYWSRTSTV